MSPLYSAVNRYGPAVGITTGNTALPPLTLIVPNTVVVPLKSLLKNLVVPVAEKGEMVAVSITACPAIAGFGLADNVIEYTGAVMVTLVTGAIVLRANWLYADRSGSSSPNLRRNMP